MPPAEGAPAAALPLHMRCGKLAAALRQPDARVRPVSRLLPLPLCIAICLTAHAAHDRPLDWSLCPLGDAVPVFADGPVSTSHPAERGLQNTDLACARTDGLMGVTVANGRSAGRAGVGEYGSN